MTRGILTDGDWDLTVAAARGGDGKIVSGLTVGETAEQDACLVLVSGKGEFKEHAVLGAGLIRFLHSEGMEREMLHEVKTQIGLIGIGNASVTLEDGKIKIK
jgi:hypothetical protein